MKIEKYYCDLCGKPITDYINKIRIRNTKIEVAEKYRKLVVEENMLWEEYELCERCHRRLLEDLREKKGEEAE